ncbi:TPA: DNA polymerase III subunit gamma/tau, partial [Candidatus Azambacteria bacterium]|nr:DNA polymerase III subunit gamma/tau [Candidatus Azambacteria bacterium]
NVSAKVEPCNKCDACEDINHGRALDLIEIDAASNRGIDEIRDLKEGIKFAPVKTKYKVFIVDEVHMLTKEAFNALLKTLEEPPAHAIFILATTEAEKLLATILSRVQRFDFRKLTVPEIMARLGTVASCENVRADEDALRLIAVNSDGCLRDAESALEQVIALSGNAVGAKDVKEILGTIDIETAREFVNFLIKNDLAGAFRFLHQLNDGGSDPQEFAKALIGYFRKMTVLKVDSSLGKFIGAELTGEQMLNLQEQIRDVSVNDLSAILKKIVAAEQEMKKSPFPFLHLELAAVDIIEKN